MTQPAFRITLKGDKRLEQALRDPQLIAGPIRTFLETSAFAIEGRAKEKAPVDTGRLRASITSIIRPLQAVVVARVLYARFVEFGRRPGSWPPLSAMQPWARRHGFPPGRVGAFLVARAIFRRGIKPQPFMGPAVRESRREIERALDQAGRDIERKFGQVQ